MSAGVAQAPALTRKKEEKIAYMLTQFQKVCYTELKRFSYAKPSFSRRYVTAALVAAATAAVSLACKASK